MSLFGYPRQGITLRALLDNPELQQAPNLNSENSKDLKKPGSQNTFPNAGSAFLGPNLWEKPKSDGTGDFDLEYMDLDEFLSENGIPVNPEETLDGPATMSLLAAALNSSPPMSPINVSIPSPDPVSPALLSPGHVSPQPSPSPGVYFPESPQLPLASPLSLSAPQSPAESTEKTISATGDTSKVHKPVKRGTLGDLLSASPKLLKVPTLEFSDSNQAVSVVSIPVYSDLALERMTPSPRGLSDIGTPCPLSPCSTASSSSLIDNETVLVEMPGQEGFDPTCRKFSEEELKPQPMIKKSKKVFVADDSKDDKYWSRRKKNNIAAKRSRDARRVKENQIAMRASFLEEQNDILGAELKKVQKENKELLRRLAQYEKLS